MQGRHFSNEHKKKLSESRKWYLENVKFNLGIDVRTIGKIPCLMCRVNMISIFNKSGLCIICGKESKLKRNQDSKYRS